MFSLYNGGVVTGKLIQTLASPFPVCITDSDCPDLAGSGNLSCFGYFCYPWRDENIVEAKDRISLCRNKKDCASGKECFRHHDKRRISKGLCLDEISNCNHDDQKCRKGSECCGGKCCSDVYYKKYRQLSCTTDEFCQDIGLGHFCCSSKKDDRLKTCCDTQPDSDESNRPSPTANEGKINFLE